jgi:hypothetical protein
VRAEIPSKINVLRASDFRETAPAAASEDMYNDDIYGSIRGGLASGVPGDLRGLEYLHKKHGVSSSFFLKYIWLTRFRYFLGELFVIQLFTLLDMGFEVLLLSHLHSSKC